MQKRFVIEQNVGMVDRVVRFIIGVGLIVASPLLGWNAWTATILGAGGGSLITESLTGY